MRSVWAQRLVVFALGVGLALQGASFVRSATRCDYMRLAKAERPPCCQLGAVPRLTRPGGDCCKNVVIGEEDPAGRTPTPEVAPAAIACVLRAPVAVAPPPALAHPWAHAPARAPPVIRNPTRNVVIRS